MKSDMLLAVMQLALERDLPQKAVVSAFEYAIAAAYRRESEAEGYDVAARLNPETGDVEISTVLHVVDYIDDIDEQGLIAVEDARAFDKNAIAGDDIITGKLEFKPQRIAARTVTQVLMQRLRNAERQLVFEQFADKEGELISAPIRRIDSSRSLPGDRPAVMLDLGKADAFLPPNEQPPNERYRVGMELRVYVVQVSQGDPDGDSVPEIIVSRTHPRLLLRLLEAEVPEVSSGMVEIKGIAREPGSRSKVAVYSHKHDIDPIGACVGLRGIRIQNIVAELMGEKIDILEWIDNSTVFVSNSLGPAEVEKVTVLADGSAEVVVPDSQLSLAIGREGQNVALATRLTGFVIDIKGASEYAEEQIALQRELEAQVAAAAERAKEKAIEEQELAAIAIEEQEEDADAERREIEIVAVHEENDETLELVVEAEATESVTDQIVDTDPIKSSVAPTIFVPASPVHLEPEPDLAEPEAESEPEEDLDFELLELEEKLRELEQEEEERQEAERIAAEQKALEQDIDDDDLWLLPDELGVAADSQESGIVFAEDIPEYRDRSSSGSPRRGNNRRRGGPRRSSR